MNNCEHWHLFGVFEFFEIIIKSCISKSKLYFDNNKCKILYTNKEYGYYFGADGNYHDVKTNEIIFVRFIDTCYGHEIVIYNKNNQMIRTPTAELHRKETNRFIKKFNNKFPDVDLLQFITVYKSNETFRQVGNNKIFIDKKTKCKYIMRQILLSSEYFYIDNMQNFFIDVFMNCENCHIERISDEYNFKLFILSKINNQPIINYTKLQELFNKINVYQDKKVIQNKQTAYHNWGKQTSMMVGEFCRVPMCKQRELTLYDMSMIYQKYIH